MSIYSDALIKNCVGQAMQRLFDSKGVYINSDGCANAAYEDVEPFLEIPVTKEKAQEFIDYYNKNVKFLMGFR